MSIYQSASETEEKVTAHRPFAPGMNSIYDDDKDVDDGRAALAPSLSRCCTHERDHELRPYVSPRNGDRHIHVDSLGEGPVAPRAAAETIVAAEEGIEDVSPGVKGWVCLLGAFLMNFIVYGMTNSFGVFQNYYAHNQLSSSSASQISWIGSIQLCLTPLLGCISGPLFDAGYLKHLIVTGGSLYVFCMFMTSIAKVYWQFLLAHGIGVGLGMGIMFSPSVSTLSHHFGKSKYRSLAYGVQASGSSASGILLPILARNLFPAVGFAWTVRIFGFIVLAVVIAVFFCLSTVHPPRKEIAVLSPTVFRNIGYCFHTLGAGCGSAAIYCPLTFSVTYGVSRGFSDSLANYSYISDLPFGPSAETRLAIINGSSAFGRITPLLAAQWVGFINVHATFAVTSAIMLFCWTRARDVTGVLVFDALYGVSSGAYAAAYNGAAASFAPCPNQVGLYIGMSFFTTSFFWLAGTPITAALIKGDDYLPASMFCGAIVGLGAALLWTARFIRSRQVGSQAV